MPKMERASSLNPEEAERPRVMFPTRASVDSGSSESTLNETEHDPELRPIRSAPVEESPFQAQLRQSKWQPDTPKKSAVVGSGHTNDKEKRLQVTVPIEEIDGVDVPLTMTEVVEDNGDELALLTFAKGDGEDPFNWSQGRKAFISVLLCLMTLFIGLATTSYSSGLGDMTREFDVSEEIGQLGLFLFNIVCAIAPLFLAPFCKTCA